MRRIISSTKKLLPCRPRRNEKACRQLKTRYVSLIDEKSFDLDSFPPEQQEYVHCERCFGHIFSINIKICPKEREPWTVFYRNSRNMSIVKGVLDTFWNKYKNMSKGARTLDSFLPEQQEYVHCERCFGHILE
jgi:hypothetical protein